MCEPDQETPEFQKDLKIWNIVFRWILLVGANSNWGGGRGEQIVKKGTDGSNT